jgi:AcrR family transcriptional regulator
LSKLQSNKERNRRRIIDASFEVFVKIGLDKASIADIVQESGLARGTFYNYFETKEEVWSELLLIFLTRFSSAAHHARTERGKDARSFIEQGYKGFLEILEDPKLLALIFQNQTAVRSTLLQTGALEGVFNLLEVDMKESGFFDHLTPRKRYLAGVSMVGAAFEIIVQLGSKGEQLDSAKLASELADLFVFGIGKFRPAGIKSA